jgi:hypothetical protein
MEARLACPICVCAERGYLEVAGWGSEGKDMGGVKVKGRTSQGCGEKVFYQSTNGGGFSEKCT